MRDKPKSFLGVESETPRVSLHAPPGGTVKKGEKRSGTDIQKMLLSIMEREDSYIEIRALT